MHSNAIECNKMMEENLTENTVFIFTENIHNHIPYCIAYNYPDNKIYNTNLEELWTDVYFYNRQNLIKDISNENDLCLVINQDEDPLEEFQDVPFIKANISNYEAVKFYFLKKGETYGKQ